MKGVRFVAEFSLRYHHVVRTKDLPESPVWPRAGS